MSTELYLACLEHDPPVFSYNAVGHNTTSETLAHLRVNLQDREFMTRLDEQFDVYWERPEEYTMLMFFKTHLKCRIAIQTEYGTWIDLGMGVPPGVIMYDLR